MTSESIVNPLASPVPMFCVVLVPVNCNIPPSVFAVVDESIKCPASLIVPVPVTLVAVVTRMFWLNAAVVMRRRTNANSAALPVRCVDVAFIALLLIDTIIVLGDSDLMFCVFKLPAELLAGATIVTRSCSRNVETAWNPPLAEEYGKRKISFMFHFPSFPFPSAFMAVAVCSWRMSFLFMLLFIYLLMSVNNSVVD